MNIDLTEFALSGKFGDIQVGMSKEDVLKTIGEPDTTENIDEETEICYKDGYEYLFEVGVLSAIQNLKFKSTKFDKARQKIPFDELTIEQSISQNTDVSLFEMKAILDEKGVTYVEKATGQGKQLTFSSGSFMQFENADNDDDLFIETTEPSNSPDDTQTLKAIGHTPFN